MRIFKCVACFVFGVNANSVNIFYKMVTIAGKKGCVDAFVRPGLALKFGANKGTCKDQNCHILKGKKTIPFCCTVHGYECEAE